MASLMSWMPDAASVRADLAFVPELQTSAECSWRGMIMRQCTNDPLSLSVGNWSRVLALNWSIPLTAACVYLASIVAEEAGAGQGQVRREGLRVLLECVPVAFLLGWCLRLRASVAGSLGRAWPVFRHVCACRVVWNGR